MKTVRKVRSRVKSLKLRKVRFTSRAQREADFQARLVELEKIRQLCQPPPEPPPVKKPMLVLIRVPVARELQLWTLGDRQVGKFIPAWEYRATFLYRFLHPEMIPGAPQQPPSDVGPEPVYRE